MKKIIITMIALLTATAAYAACSTHTYVVNGKVIVCSVCCDRNNNCSEVCS